MIFKGK